MKQEILQLGDDELLRVISLWQPWAQWVMLGWKTIETRLHNRFRGLVGQRIGIHAANVWDVKSMMAARDYLTPEQVAETAAWLLPDAKRAGGRLLGTVAVSEHRLLEPADSAAALIECNTFRYGLMLYSPKPLPVPIKMGGHQGIWRYKLAA